MLLRSGFYHSPEGRALALFAAIAFCLMIFTFHRKPLDGIPAKATWGWQMPPSTQAPDPDPGRPRPSFRDLAIQFGTHKATVHKYHIMYEKYFPGIRDRPVKLLEIGLGCDEYADDDDDHHKYGKPENHEPQEFYSDVGAGVQGDNPDKAIRVRKTGDRDLSKVGASYHTFTSYFPKLALTYIESNAACARDFSSGHDKALIFVGDQGDAAFLDRFAAQSTIHGLFDVVIDDGAGTDDRQERSLRDLWRVVRPGGVYFVEGVRKKGDDDERTAEKAGRVDNAKQDDGGQTDRKDQQRSFRDFVEDLLWEDVMVSEGEVMGIDCMEGVCAFFKKAD